MRNDPIQSDFSGGEISPRAQGHVDSDLYKAAAARMANLLPTDQGSCASRAGGQLVPLDLTQFNPLPPYLITLPSSLGLPDDLVLSLGGPFGKVFIQNKEGPVSIHEAVPIVPEPTGNDPCVTQWGTTAPTISFADGLAGKLCLRQALGVQDGGISIALPLGAGGGSGVYTFTFTVVGDPVYLHIGTPAVFHANDYLGPTLFTAGVHTVTFTPVAASWVIIFNFPDIASAYATDIIKMSCTRAGMAFGLNLPSSVGDINKLRHTEFWTNGSFYIILTGDFAAPMQIVYTPPAAPGDRTNPVWSCGLMTFALLNAQGTVYNLAGTCPFPSVINCIAYQNRLWFALGDVDGHLVATTVGYGILIASGAFVFNFATALTKTLSFVATSNQAIFAFAIQVTAAQSVLVTVAGNITPVLALALATDQNATPGGTFTLSPQTAGTVVVLSVVPRVKATDALDLKMQAPAGRVSWFAVLRGLLLGTTLREMVFSSQASLALDPANGMVFDIIEQSQHGSAKYAPVATVGEKVMFATLGRQRILSASWRPSNNPYAQQSAGFVAEDFSAIAEHITDARVTAMTFLRAPTPRLALCFDDGTAALVTFAGKGQGWSRLTISGKNICHVAALDTDFGSELWLGCTDGTILRIANPDSKVVNKTVLLSGFARTKFDQHLPNPPSMDEWQVCPVTAGGVVPVSAQLLGSTLAIILNGQYTGTAVALTDGAGGAQVNIPTSTPVFYLDPVQGRVPATVCVGLVYPEQTLTTLPFEGGVPSGSSQGYKSRRVKQYLRLVDSYMPLVDGQRAPERQGADRTDQQASRFTGDIELTGLGWAEGKTMTVSMDLPLRIEISAIFGSTAINSA